MVYEFLISDLIQNSSKKNIGTDKGLAKLGDEIVNLAYSMAKSIYLTKKSTNKIYRTGLKVNKRILSDALKNAQMKSFAKSRADAHDLANTVEAIIAYVWLYNKMSLNEMIDFLTNNLSGDLNIRVEEIQSATQAFTNLLNYLKKDLPEN